ncbi:MAG: tetratricopeptide (TPR) repeat protein/glycosyltransferase involved in cell wall biosynthesis [Candidatus Latescibacterota bacterium]|jgi:tetratricopeptide (TPR) repeat protein/glycosyltransferase involved in cell wall biosynthesis
MDISVIIATHKQKERLRLVLSALDKQSIGEKFFEIVVVDDGSTDGTRTMLNSLQIANLHVESFDANQGRCQARNTGIKKACGDLLVFLDGDALPSPDLLECYWQAHTTNGVNAVLCGDQYVLPQLEFFQDPQTGALLDAPLSCSARRHLAQQHERILVTEDRVREDFAAIAAQAIEGGYPFPQVRALQREFHELCETVPDSALGWLGLYPHNMAVPSVLLEQVGGFDEAITFCEGWELGYRLKMAGGKFIRARALSYHLYHHHDFSDPAKAKTEAAKRYAAIDYIAHKHGDPLVRLIHFWWAHLWPNPFFPEESILCSLVEFDRLYRTISAKKWRSYCSVLDHLEPPAPNETISSESINEQPAEPSRALQSSREWEALLASAEEHRQKGRIEKALSQIEKALVVQRRQGGEDSGLASLLISQGRTHELSGDLARAGCCYDRAISICAKVGDTEKLATGYSCKGFVMQLRHDFDAAIDLHTKSLRINEKIEQRKAAALDLGNLGIVHFLKGELRVAEKFYEESKTLYHEIGYFAGVANQYNSLANLRKSQGRLHEAQELLERALEIDLESNRQEGLALHYGLLSSLQLLRGDVTQALAHGEAALAANQSLADTKGQAYAHGVLAEVHFQRGDSSLAESHLLHSIDLFERMGMSVNIADRHLFLGKLYTKTKELDKAEDALLHCLHLAPNPRLVAAARTSLSLVHIERKDYAEAQRQRKAALAIYESENERQLVAYGLAALGEIHALKKEWDSAESHYRRALSAFEKVGDEMGQAVVYDSMGDAALQGEEKARACALWKMASMYFIRMGMDEPSARSNAKIGALQSTQPSTEATSGKVHPL